MRQRRQRRPPLAGSPMPRYSATIPLGPRRWRPTGSPACRNAVIRRQLKKSESCGRTKQHPWVKARQAGTYRSPALVHHRRRPQPGLPSRATGAAVGWSGS